MKATGFLALVLAATSLAGCYTYASYATYAPPPVRVETFGVAPGPGYVWVNGFYTYRGNNYAWTPGRWAVPPRGRHVWEPGRWENRGGRYQFRQGRWR
jgi:WXXGXW repeat (2 copies)